MPASRKARAMTFAPRSWPSKPGLATSTRMRGSIYILMVALRVALARQIGWNSPDFQIGLDACVELRLHRSLWCCGSDLPFGGICCKRAIPVDLPSEVHGGCDGEETGKGSNEQRVVLNP